MSDRETFLDSAARASLERALFEAVRDLLYFEGKADREADPRYAGMIETNVRAAFDRHLERDWPAARQDLQDLSDARLQDHLMDAIDRLDALGQQAWVAQRKVQGGSAFNRQLEEMAKRIEEAEMDRRREWGIER